MASIEQAVRRVRKLTSTPVADAQILTAGHMTLKVKVTLADERELLVRSYPPGRETIAEFEPELLERLLQAGASVPTPLSYSTHFSDAYLIYEMLPGVSLDRFITRLTSGELERVAQAVFEQLTILASLEVSGWGDMKSAVCADCDTWRAFVFSLNLSQLYPNAPSWLVKATDKLRWIAETRVAPLRSTLVWTDLSPENIIVNEKGHFIGLIDLESVMALEPDATYGYLDARYRFTRFHQFFTSPFLIGAKSQDLRSIYALIRALRILPHRLEPLPAGGVRDPLHIFLPGLEEACKNVLNLGRSV